MKNKPFYLSGVNGMFRKGDILKANSSGTEMIVLNENCKDQRWRKVLRYFGFKIFNPTGCIKVKRYDR